MRGHLPEAGDVRGHEHGATGAMGNLGQMRVVDEAAADFGSRLALEPRDLILDGQVNDLHPVEDMLRQERDRGLGGEAVVGRKARGHREELEATMPGRDASAKATGRKCFEDGAARGVGGDFQQTRHEDVRVEKDLF